MSDEAAGTPAPPENNGDKPKGFLETITGQIIALTALDSHAHSGSIDSGISDPFAYVRNSKDGSTG